MKKIGECDHHKAPSEKKDISQNLPQIQYHIAHLLYALKPLTITGNAEQLNYFYRQITQLELATGDLTYIWK
jgi:hypothetical protein